MINKRNESKNKGITLIVLVVTIVVLLILAVTSYNLIIGNDGIFNRAKYGTNVYENAVKNEERELDAGAELIDEYLFD